MMKKFFALFLVSTVLFCLGSPFAMAAMSDQLIFRYLSYNGGENQNIIEEQLDNSSYGIPVAYTTPGNNFYFTDMSFISRDSDFYAGSLGLYVSFYGYVTYTEGSTAPSFRSSGKDMSTYFGMEYLTSQGALGSGSITYEEFTPSYTAENTVVGSGYTLKASTVGTKDSKVSGLSIVPISSQTQYQFYSGSNFNIESGKFCIPSWGFVVTSTSEELASLESIADEIAAQSGIMSAMYGDIMSVLNSMYSRLGDMQAVQEAANVYFGAMVQYLSSIDTTTTNIYSLLQTQFALLKSTIETESNNIQDAISAQTAALIAYFDEALAGSVGSLPEQSDDVKEQVGSNDNVTSEYESDAAARFEQLASTFNGFSGGTLDGIALASTLFTRVFNALGQYQIVYTFPLLLGLCLVLVGRLSKSKTEVEKDGEGE